MKISRTAVLIGVNVALAGLIAWLWVDPQGRLRNTQWEPPTAIRPDFGTVPPGLAGSGDADASRMMAILDRPVFSASRRPTPVVVKDAAPPKPDPLNNIHVYGVYGGAEGGGLIALVEGRTRRMRTSETLGDWTLKEVRGHQAVFARGAETRTVAVVQARQDGGTPVARAGVSPSGGARPPGFGSAGGAFDPYARLRELRERQLNSRAGMASQVTPRPAPSPAASPGAESAPGAGSQPAEVPVAPAPATPARPASPAGTGPAPFSIGGSR